MKQETINAIINYLVTKPFNEVFQIINLIQEDLKEEQNKTNE